MAQQPGCGVAGEDGPLEPDDGVGAGGGSFIAADFSDVSILAGANSNGVGSVVITAVSPAPVSPAPVPEPASLALLGTGLLGLGLAQRRRKVT